MKKLFLLSVLFIHARCQTIGGYCSDEGGIPCDVYGGTLERKRNILNNLPRREPGQVGTTVRESVGNGRKQTVITRAQYPPIFELPNFLTAKECDHIVNLAIKSGMQEATMFGNNGLYSKAKLRTAQTTFVAGSKDKVLRQIQNRAIALTKLPEEVLYNSEEFQIGLYESGGFYSFHYDSHPVSRETLMSKPCCQYAEKPHSANKCTICRYVTFLMYLNKVEEGGATAFPLADKPGINITKEHKDMDLNCKDAPVLVSPKKGTAVMWYNNIIDPEHGWLGVYDPCSLHGGCPILKGQKWISNLWINAPQYHSVNKRTIYHDEL